MNLISVTTSSGTASLNTHHSTVNELFGDEDFREDFGIPPHARPLVDNVAVDGSTPLTPGMDVSFQIPASEKN